MTQPHYIDLAQAKKAADDLVAAGLIYEDEALLKDAEAVQAFLRAAPMEAVAWREKVADQWADECGVRTMAEAVGDVFSKWADADLLRRFHDQVEALMRQSFLEGMERQALAVIPTEGGETPDETKGGS